MQTIYDRQTAHFTGSSRWSLAAAPALTNARSIAATQTSAFSGPVALKPNGNGSAQADRSLIETLIQSSVYKRYEQAFTEATGLPLALRPVESWQLPLHGKAHESPFCALMSQKSHACASCLQMQERLSQAAAEGPRTMVCPSGLCETSVPVRLGDRLIGYLQTGQVFSKRPTETQFGRTANLLSQRGVEINRGELKEAFFATRVVSPKQQESIATLLAIFANHLSMLSNQVVVRRENAEPPVITKAKAYIEQHQGENVHLGEVAKAVNMSSFYFCKVFRRATGINFTHYLARVRIEKSKNLLLNPNLRISEIAFEVGFQSLTHFNRVFKKLVGQSPTEYRGQLTRATA
jgi:AraC-like DNA-binding protein